MAATLLQTDSVLRPQAQEGTTGIHLPRSETGFGQRLLLHKLRHSKNGNWSGKKTTRQFQYGHLLSRPSDTPDDAFPGPTSLPKVEVVLHCGDFTMIGGLSNYKKAIENIKALNAELKLVIAGDHDVSLDWAWWQVNLDEDGDPDEPSNALNLFRSGQANGLYLLKEGPHKFTLSGNRTFTVYASPWTPEFNGYAFENGPDQDPFGPEVSDPIPYHGIDIVMTHTRHWFLLRRTSSILIETVNIADAQSCTRQFENPSPGSVVSATFTRAMGYRGYPGTPIQIQRRIPEVGEVCRD